MWNEWADEAWRRSRHMMLIWRGACSAVLGLRCSLFHLSWALKGFFIPSCFKVDNKSWNTLCCSLIGTLWASGRAWPFRTLRTSWSSGPQWSLYSGTPGKTLLVCVCMCIITPHLGQLNSYLIISTLRYGKDNLASSLSKLKSVALIIIITNFIGTVPLCNSR